MRILLCFCLLLFAALPATAQTAVQARVEKQFQTWLATTVRADAQKRGISRQTLDTALSGLTLDWTLPDLAPPGIPRKKEEPQRQAEFSGPDRKSVV